MMAETVGLIPIWRINLGTEKGKWNLKEEETIPMRTSSHRYFAVLISTMALVAAACSGGAQPAGTEPVESTQAEAEPSTSDPVVADLSTSSREALLEGARSEGTVSALLHMETGSLADVEAAFEAEFPFIDANLVDSGGGDAAQAFLLELQAGVAQGQWDVLSLSSDVLNETKEFMVPIDLLSMQEQGVIDLDPRNIDPVDRNLIAAATNLGVIAYNSDLVSPDQAPQTWEALLEPQWSSNQMLTDIRPFETAALAPAWGDEKLLEYTQGIAAQDPVWVRGHDAALIAMAVGEYSVHSAMNLRQVQILVEDGYTNLEYVAPEPISLRLTELHGLIEGAPSPHAGILLLEFLLSEEGQAAWYQNEFVASAFAEGSTQSEIIEDREVSLVGWEEIDDFERYVELVREGYGFPEVEVELPEA